MKKNRKGFVIAGLLVLCAVITFGVFILGQSPKVTDGEIIDVETGGRDVTPVSIADNPADVTVPDIQPSGINQSEDTARNSAGTLQNGNEIILTAIEAKPEPPENPETAHHCGDDCEEHSTPPAITDSALTNPDEKPDSTPVPAATTQPQATAAPQSGDKNGNGEIYIPGFGYVKDEGGGSQGSQSKLDPNHSDFDKMVGH